MLWFPILVISPPKALRKIDVIPLKERGCFIKIFLHACMFRVKTIPVVRTPDFFFPIVPFSFVLPVAAATFLPKFLKFWAPPYHLKLFDLMRSCFDSEYQIAACFRDRLGLIFVLDRGCEFGEVKFLSFKAAISQKERL